MNMSMSTAVTDPTSMRFLTNDIDECKEYFKAQQGTRRFDALGGRSFKGFQHREWPVGRISLSKIEMSCTGDFTVTKAAPAGYYQFNFLLEGNCKVKGRFGTVIAKPGDAFVVDPDQQVTERWEDRMSQYLLRIDRQLIEGMLSAELGKALKEPVVFDPIAHGRGMEAWLGHLANSSAQSQTTLLSDRRVLKSVEDMLLTMVLSSFRHTETESLSRSSNGAAAYYVRRAEEHIHANVCNDLSIEEIAEAAKVSPRTLYYGFKRWRGTTPMAYVRDARLDLARKDLKQGRVSGGTVTSAAINSGFTNFSQFSRNYKARFGESPSSTLLGR